MSRSKWGAHGKVLERVDGSMMMTFRPSCRVFNDKDLAMLLGWQIEVTVPADRWSDDPPKTYDESVEQISKWESRNGRLTQARALSLVNSLYHLALWEMGDDTYERFDPKKESHQAMLEKVRQIWPAFNKGEAR